MDTIWNVVNQTTSQLLQWCADNLLIVYIGGGVIFALILIIIMTKALRRKKKKVYHEEDREFDIMEEVSFSRSSEIIM